MLIDQYLPSPFGSSHASWIVNGEHYWDRFTAIVAARDQFGSAIVAEEYIILLETTYRDRLVAAKLAVRSDV